MQQNRFLQNLGLAKRANKAVFGFDDVVKHISLNDAKAVFIASDTAENTQKKITRICGENGVKTVRVPFASRDIGNASGRKPTAVFTVTDNGFYSLLIRSLSENGGNA